MKELTEYEMQESSGGGIAAGITGWAIFTLIASNWADIKRGIADGWADSGLR